jgi:ubiquinone/menaquinone biosynthesis C-methylase UbiE
MKPEKKYSDIAWYHADVTQLPMENDCFDDVICILATHPIKHIDQAYSEAYRIIKKGKFVIFTSTPNQMKH